MRVTIIADASHCPRTQAAGYGYWVTSERGARAGEGAFRTQLGSAAIAEMGAIVSALKGAIAHRIADHGDSILIQTDCIVAIHYFQGLVRKRKNPVMAVIAVELLELLSAHAMSVEFRHVKGHSRVTDNRSVAQRHCDKRARRGMNEARSAADLALLVERGENFAPLPRTERPRAPFRTERMGETRCTDNSLPKWDGSGLPWD